MSNVLAIFDRDNPSVRLSYQFLEVALSSVACFRYMPVVDVRALDLVWADSVISIRGNDRLTSHVLRIAKKMGCYLALMADDNLAELPEGYIIDPGRIRAFRAILGQVDCVISDTEVLANRLCELAGINHYAIFDTVVDEKILRGPPEPDAAPHIVYAAGRGHEQFFVEYVLPALELLSQRDDVPDYELTFMGVSPIVGSLKGCKAIHRIPYLDMDSYQKLIRESGFTIGLAPLHDDGFCRYKYFNKFIEYASAGITGIYSDCLPFSLIVKDGFNGALCVNDPQEWARSLYCLLTNQGLRFQLASRAQEVLRRDFTREKVVGRFLDDFPELLSFKKKKTAPPWVLSASICFHLVAHKFWRVKERFYLSVLVFRRHGLSSLLKRLHF